MVVVYKDIMVHCHADGNDLEEAEKLIFAEKREKPQHLVEDCQRKHGQQVCSNRCEGELYG